MFKINFRKYLKVDLARGINFFASSFSKFLFVGNINQDAFVDRVSKSLYLVLANAEQPGLYDSFNPEDILIGSAGLGQDRLGLSTITKTEDLYPLSDSEQAQLPGGNYGFMYLAPFDPHKDYKLIAQYIKLSGQDKYILIGGFANNASEIQFAYEQDRTFVTSKSLPSIEYHQSVPNRIMREMVANSANYLVLSTGVISTLEAMQDKKLPFYQTHSLNEEFVAAYLLAVKSIISSDNSLCGLVPDMVIELSKLLFSDKPLSKMDMKRTNDLLKLDFINSRLVSTNQTIIERANGKIAPKLLAFLGNPRKTKDQEQLATVCFSLRKSGEIGSPVHDQALRRAAAWGRLFELKVLIKSMQKPDLDKVDSNFGRTALHWAVVSKNFDCMGILIKAGASLDIQDAEGQTPLHKAVKIGDRAAIKALIEAGASVDISDKRDKTPAECSTDNDTLFFISLCENKGEAVSILEH